MPHVWHAVYEATAYFIAYNNIYVSGFEKRGNFMQNTIFLALFKLAITIQSVRASVLWAHQAFSINSDDNDNG